MRRRKRKLLSWQTLPPFPTTGSCKLNGEEPENLVLPCLSRLKDGSFLSKIYSSSGDRRRDRSGIQVRVIEYWLEGIQTENDPEVYRLVTTIMDPTIAPVEELSALCHERWDLETAFDELKTHSRGAGAWFSEAGPRIG
jgi:hypothetical protein